MSDNLDNGHWHLDKRISWGHIATTLGMCLAAVLWFVTLQGRIETNTLNIENIIKQEARHEQFEHTRLEAQLNSQTKRLEGRMEAQYNEIIRRLEILDQRMVDNAREDNKKH